MKFSYSITFGEALTSLCITGSALVIVLSWKSDRDLLKREDADKIRIEAAQTLGKVHRSRDIYLSFYDAIQSDLVDVSEAAEKTKSNTVIRDLLWQHIQQRRFETGRMIFDEQLEVAYSGLLPFDEGIDSIYASTMTKLKALHRNEMSQLLTETQAVVLSLGPSHGQTALMGNALRDVLADRRKDHEDLIRRGVLPLETHLKELMRRPDGVLLSREN